MLDVIPSVNLILSFHSFQHSFLALWPSGLASFFPDDSLLSGKNEDDKTIVQTIFLLSSSLRLLVSRVHKKGKVLHKEGIQTTIMPSGILDCSAGRKSFIHPRLILFPNSECENNYLS